MKLPYLELLQRRGVFHGGDENFNSPYEARERVDFFKLERTGKRGISPYH